MPPTAIGPFTIERALGRGGMGEVYLARDTRLDRPVAIKALPAHLAADPDRLARFQREAKVLASLNHPGIGAIYGLETANGHQYLILEFIEGETLADRLAKGPIAIEESLTLARQIAEALEIAHEKGVVHRDLKPSNVMVTHEGVAKVLDFGLARSAEAPGSSSSNAASPVSPTLTSPMPVHSPTIPGAIMGTAGYMSPEQARGKPVDKRSDIFSFGCVLYEMLTGATPFRGETVADALGATLHKETDLSILPPGTPRRVRELLINCLAKDRRNRLHDIGDARLELERALAGQEWAREDAHAATDARARSAKPLGVSLALVAGAIGLAGLGGWMLAISLAPKGTPTRAQTLYLAATVPSKPIFGALAGISPDGSFLVYTAWPELPPESTKAEGVLMIRRLDRDETISIEGTEGARDAALSPDGRSVVFSCLRDRSGSRMSLRKITLEGGRPAGKAETICELPNAAQLSLGWSSDRDVVFAPSWETSIYQVSTSGGEPRAVLREEGPTGIENWGDLRPLVPGKLILATRWAFVGQKIRLATEVIDLVAGTRKAVLPDAGVASFVSDEQGGYLVAMRPAQTNLVAVRFDLRRLQTIGEPTTVWSGNPVTAFHISTGGTMAIATRPLDVPDRKMAWVDEKGQPQPIPGLMRSFGNGFSLSPDGGRLLANMDATASVELISECWVMDLARRTNARIPVKGAMIGSAWHTDGQHFTYGLARDGGFALWQRRSDGTGEAVKLYDTPDARSLAAPTCWTPDGKRLAFVLVDLSSDSADAYVLEPDAGGKWTAKPYIKTPANEGIAAFSPDGKWTIISSSQSGRDELYVQPFTGDGEADARGGRKQISTSGGGACWWSPDGSEIRFVDGNRQIVSVQVKTEPTFSASEPKPLYSIKDLKTRGNVFAPDGRLLVLLQGESEQTTAAVGLVVNFVDELRAKLSGK
jgi:Tol biopolymer transport system component